MGRVEQIEAQIEKLDANIFNKFRDCCLGHVRDRWDQQIESEAAAGKLAFLLEEASEAERRGEIRPL